MTTVKQVLLGAAVAGVVAGGGSAVGTAIAYAEPSDTTSSAGASDSSSDTNAGPTQRRGNTAKPALRSGGAAGGDDVSGPRSRVRSQSSSATSDSIVIPDIVTDSNNKPSAAASVAAPAATAAAVATAAQDAPEPVSAPVVIDTPAVAPAPSVAPVIPTAPVTTARAVTPTFPVIEALARVVAALETATTLTPAPAASSPVPLRIPLLPLLPTLPVAPVAPAGAATVSATTSTSSRTRAASAVAEAVIIGDPTATHVLLIGTDGTNLNKVLQYTWDNAASTGFQELMEVGTTSATSIVGHTTISGPSWTTILTGVWDSKSGVINNLFNPAPYNKWPTVFNMLENYNSGISTAVVADWKYINDIAGAGSNPVDANHYIDFDTDWAQTDQHVTDKTIELITNADVDTPTFIFSYQVQVDEAGHAHGGGSEEYKQAVINVGDNISEIMDAVKLMEETTGVDWTVIVTTDHGHQQSHGFGHGFQSPNETSSFIIFDLAGDPSGGLQNQSYANTDITPTIVNLFGAPMRSDFDGVPLTTKDSGIVAPVDLKTSLNDAVSMYGYPNIGVDLALGTRTVFATVPYLIDGLVNNVTAMLQGIVDQDIFLISGLADITKWIVQFNGNLMVGVTQAVARVVAHLTGSGVIPPSDPPLTSSNEDPFLLAAAVLA